MSVFFAMIKEINYRAVKGDGMDRFVYYPDAMFSLDTQWKSHLASLRSVDDPREAIVHALKAYNARATHSDEIAQTQLSQLREMNDGMQKGFHHLQHGINVLGRRVNDMEDSMLQAAVAQIMTARQNAAQIVGAVHYVAESVQDVADSVQTTVHNAAENIQNAIGGVQEVIRSGFQDIYDALISLGQGVRDDLSMLADQQRINNLIQNNIAILLRVPDFQKERLYYIEQGFKHYKNAGIDSALMVDALENLQKALELEKSDYVVLHRLGMIHLYSDDFLNFAKAKEYFLKAGRYAAVEADPNAVRLAQVLTGDLDKPLNEQNGDLKQIRWLAADSYLRAAFACHLLQEKEEAIQHASKAVEIAPDLKAAKFKLAIYLANGGGWIRHWQFLKP